MKTVSNFHKILHQLRIDFFRYGLTPQRFWLLPALAFHNPGMLFSTIYRLERYLLYQSNDIFRLIGLFFYPLYFFIIYYLLSYSIEPSVEIGEGLFLHNRGIVITHPAIIGKNVSIMGSTTIGTDFDPKNTNIYIGNNVRIGVGAKIIAKGKLFIADNVTIGANAVVTKNITEKNSIYGGIPAKRIK